jgi:hypothetical protein
VVQKIAHTDILSALSKQTRLYARRLRCSARKFSDCEGQYEKGQFVVIIMQYFQWGAVRYSIEEIVMMAMSPVGVTKTSEAVSFFHQLRFSLGASLLKLTFNLLHAQLHREFGAKRTRVTIHAHSL